MEKCKIAQREQVSEWTGVRCIFLARTSSKMSSFVNQCLTSSELVVHHRWRSTDDFYSRIGVGCKSVSRISQMLRGLTPEIVMDVANFFLKSTWKWRFVVANGGGACLVRLHLHTPMKSASSWGCRRTGRHIYPTASMKEIKTWTLPPSLESKMLYCSINGIKG